MNFYEKISKFFVENPIKLFTLFILITIGLALSYSFIPYRGDASTSPKDPIIDLDIEISKKFSDEVHFTLFLLETPNGEDILSKKYLYEILKASQELRNKDLNKELSPETIEAKSHLFRYVDSETGIEVEGILTLADVVDNILRLNPKYNKNLESASNQEVKEIISELLKGDQIKDIKRNISINSNVEKKKINGNEIDWWTSPAMLIVILGDNESLGGGSQRVALGGDKNTLDKENYNIKVLDVLKKVGIKDLPKKIPVTLVDNKSDLIKKSGHRHGNIQGYTNYEESSLAGKIINQDYHIYILSNLHKEIFNAVLAHELLHVYLFQNQIDLKSDIREGFCNLGSSLIYENYRSKLSKYKLKNMNENIDPDYGIGFRKMKSMRDKIGWKSLLKKLPRMKE